MFLIIGISLISLGGSYLVINSFNNTLTEENLTFTGNENITRYVSVPRYANVTGAFMNLSGYLGGDIINTDSIDESANCYNGTTGSISNCQKLYDENLSTGLAAKNQTTYFINIQDTPIVEEDNLTSVDIYLYYFPIWQTPSISGLKNIYNLSLWNYDTNVWVNIDSKTDAEGDRCDFGSTYSGGITWVGLFYDEGNSKISNGGSNLLCKYKFVTITSPGQYFNFTDNLRRNWTVTQYNYSTGSGSYGGGGFIEDEIVWNYDNETLSNPFLQIGNIDSINEWSYINWFKQKDNQTNNLESSFNNALNDTKCNCLNCSINGKNCTIPLIFHSDSSGILGYSAINITYDPIPEVYLITPDNNSYSSVNKNFTCNMSDESGLVNSTFYIWSSGDVVSANYTLNITGVNNETTFPVTFAVSDTYHWNCFIENNHLMTRWADFNRTIIVDVTDNVITLNKPVNNSWKNNGTNVDFNCTVEGTNLDAIFFYTNTSGSYKLNQTKSGVTTEVINTFRLNLTDGSYKWSCGGNKTTSATINISQYGNYTFGIDSVIPNLTLNTISITAGSQTISVNLTIADDRSGLNNCKYSVYSNHTSGAVDGLNSNVSFTCGNLATPTVSAYATYMYETYVTDNAGNVNFINATFTTSPSESTVINIGGGGGGSDVINISFEADLYLPDRYKFFFWNDEGTFNYTILLNKMATQCKPSFDWKCYTQSNSAIVETYIGLNNSFSQRKNGEFEITSKDGDVTRVGIVVRSINIGWYIPTMDLGTESIILNKYLFKIDNHKNVVGVRIWWILSLGVLTLLIVYIKRVKDRRTDEAYNVIRRLGL